MDITKWSGYVSFTTDYTTAIVKLMNSNDTFHVKLFDNYQIVSVVVENKTIFEFQDSINDPQDLSPFTRKIKNQQYLFVHGELVVKQIERKVNYLSKLDKDS